MEVAFSYDTDSFINTLGRFISRRGKCKEIVSDNGANSTSAESKLKLRKWNQEKVNDYLFQKEVKWRFNPPSASHGGEAWEQLIRTIRRVTIMILEKQSLNDEDLQLCVESNQLSMEGL